MSKFKRDFDALTFTEKKLMIEHLIVIHPQMQTILDKIDYCREHAKYALESIGLLVMGEKGTGKTKIKDIYLSRNKVTQTETATVIAYFAPR